MSCALSAYVDGNGVTGTSIRRCSVLLFWRIRYLDTRDKQFKDRDLYLETDSLSPEMKAAVELCCEVNSPTMTREVLRYRHLFQEKCPETASRFRQSRFCCLIDYFEDEHANEISPNQMGAVLTGKPDAILFPAGTPKHLMEYLRSADQPIPYDQISLSRQGCDDLACFSRDVGELTESTFLREGPGWLGNYGGNGYVLATAVTDEEIRSFVTIFRRLYMANERGSFLKAASIFVAAVGNNPLGKLVDGEKAQYEAELDRPPDFIPPPGRTSCSFRRKRLIDVFLYTQYAHQPKPGRLQQYNECLASLDNDRAKLTWLFLNELWKCSLHFQYAGQHIAAFFHEYCECKRVSSDIPASVSADNPLVGALEKEHARRDRLFRKKAEMLATEIWKQNGCPEGGPTLFLAQAREQLGRMSR